MHVFKKNIYIFFQELQIAEIFIFHAYSISIIKI